MRRLFLSFDFGWEAFVLFLLTMFVLVASWPFATADGQDQFLFEPVAYTPVVQADRDLAEDTPLEVLREQYVTVNTAVYEGRSPDGGLQINLFEDELITAVEKRVDSYENGGTVWVGALPNSPQSDISLSLSDGVMVGSFNLVDRIYRIQPVAEDSTVHVIQEVSFAKAIDLEPIPADLGDVETDRVVDGFSLVGDQTAVTADDGSVVDVYVAYTPAARAKTGGTVAMINRINLAVSETNTGYDNSGIQFDLNLAGFGEINYIETGDSLLDLDHLFSQNDGHMDSIHSLRNTYDADVVVLIADMESLYCGLAFFMTSLSTSFSPLAFSLVDYSCATGHYSFGHEIGHNMGAAHDKQVVESVSDPGYPMYDHAYGYYDPEGDFRTIMAYARFCPGTCTRVNQWSNPNKIYDPDNDGIGDVTGTDVANNCQTLTKNSETVANFRTSTSGDLLSAQVGLADSVGVAFVPDLNATHAVYLPLLMKPEPYTDPPCS